MRYRNNLVSNVVSIVGEEDSFGDCADGRWLLDDRRYFTAVDTHGRVVGQNL